LENLDDRIERLEQKLIFNPDPPVLRKIHDLKADLLHLRRSVWPLREVISGLERGESPLLQETTLIYIHDIYDHTIQVIETIEAYRDIISSMMDIYLSTISNKMSEVMKVLTIISTIFIPLTFIAGVYGMNFRYMPELEWEWGYFMIIGLMLVIGLGMVVYFKRKRWL
jgi:magnesium transporter